MCYMQPYGTVDGVAGGTIRFRSRPSKYFPTIVIRLLPWSSWLPFAHTEFDPIAQNIVHLQVCGWKLHDHRPAKDIHSTADGPGYRGSLSLLGFSGKRDLYQPTLRLCLVGWYGLGIKDGIGTVAVYASSKLGIAPASG